MSKQKNNNNNDDRLEAKKDKILKQKSKRFPLLTIAICGILAAIIISVFILTGKQETGTTTAVATEIMNSTNAAEVKYPVNLFDDNKAKFYSYKKDSITVNYFILKSSDGVIRAAFDACDVCWRAGKGYTQDGDEMICRNCGRRFASNYINEVSGGCNPAPLKRRIENENVVINVNDILEGKGYFDLGSGI